MLLVLSKDENSIGSGLAWWIVQCDCGEKKSVRGVSLRTGKTTSCGSCSRKTHGLSKTRTYSSWKSMVERCCCPSNKDFPRYGAQGIKVCPRWRKFENFFADMGERPSGCSIDRFPDNTGNYEPGNCRWASISEQAFNKKSTRVFEFNGVVDSITGWASRLGLSPTCMAKRLRKWPLHRAFTEAPRDH